MTSAILQSKKIQVAILFSKPKKRSWKRKRTRLFNSVSYTGASLQKVNSFLTQQIKN